MFWISWAGGLIEVGKGYQYGQEMFLSWQDPNPHDVGVVSVSTGWGATAEYRFMEPAGTGTII